MRAGVGGGGGMRGVLGRLLGAWVEALLDGVICVGEVWWEGEKLGD